MKLKKLILPALIIAFLLFSCEDFIFTGKDYPDTLPEPTQTGKNQIGCLINGKVFRNSMYTQI